MIRYLPQSLLRRMAPQKLVERLVTDDLTINRLVLTMLSRSGVLDKATLETIAIRVIRGYREAYGVELARGATKAEALAEAINGRRAMVQRVQNRVVFEIKQSIKSEYRGEFYEWLPSDAETPDPLHQLNYGKTFQIGKGEMPGDRHGCRCGMNILVDETRLAI